MPEVKFYVYRAVVTDYDEDASDYYTLDESPLYAEESAAREALEGLPAPLTEHGDKSVERVPVYASALDDQRASAEGGGL